MSDLPSLSPGVSKVDDENKLNENECQPSQHSKVHPSVSKSTMRDEEGSHDAHDDDEILKAPESVLNSGPGVPGRSHTNHQEAHQEKEEGDDEAHSVHRQVADGICALDLDVLRSRDNTWTSL